MESKHARTSTLTKYNFGLQENESAGKKPEASWYSDIWPYFSSSRTLKLLSLAYIWDLPNTDAPSRCGCLF